MTKQDEQDSNACVRIEKERDILQFMIDTAKNIHLVYLDPDFNFVRVNQAYAKTCGYKPEELIGKNHFTLYPDKENEAIFKRVRDTGVIAQFHDKPFTFPDQPQRGVTYWDWTLEPIKNHCGDVTGLVFSLVETTERKRAEEALMNKEQEHNDLFQNMTNGFAYCQMIYNEDGKPVDFIYLEINESFERITGLSRQQVVGKKVTDAIPGTEKANPEIFEIYGRVASTGQKASFEIFFKPLQLWLNVSVYCPRIGYFAALFEDVTERKQTQEKLKQYSEGLEALVRERTEKLKDAERLAAIGATAGMVGHDIRNPLQAIISDIYLLKGELTSMPECKTKQQVEESIEGIEKNIDYINKIIVDLQDYARAITPSYQEVDLDSLCQDILKNAIPKNVKATCLIEDDVKLILSDKVLLERILSNLVNNAVQAMPDGGMLTIHAFKEKGKVGIDVSDTGYGIPEAIKDKLFTPLVTTKSKGQGFGLAVVKRMTEALGGSVTFESEEKEGTTFFLRFTWPTG